MDIHNERVSVYEYVEKRQTEDNATFILKDEKGTIKEFKADMLIGSSILKAGVKYNIRGPVFGNYVVEGRV